MKNVTEILTEIGVEVPQEKRENLAKLVAENYVTIAEHGKKIKRVEEERDQYRDQLEAANTTLKSFEGIDPESITKELNEWKTKAENAEKDYKAKIEERDYADAVNSALENIRFSSLAAKESISAKIIAKKLPIEGGKLMGFDDYIKTLQDADKEAFLETERTPASFSESGNSGGNPDAGVTKESIMKIKDSRERQNMIAKHISLFKK